MRDFTYHNYTKLIFGKDVEKQAGDLCAKYGTKVLLHYGGGSIKKSGLYDTVTAALKKAGVDFIELGGVKPNPRLSLVYEGVKLCRDNGVGLILAVGGGSVIDSAKAISIGALEGKDVWDYFSRKRTGAAKGLPVGVILTIPAAGSESSDGTVITNEEGWLKRPYSSPHLRPDFALLNPALTFTLPTEQILNGGSDIMAHVIERYFTNVPYTDFSDRMCEAALLSMIKNLPLTLKHPYDYDIRAEIVWCGTVAHNDLLSCGRIGDWASHKMEHELSGIYDIAHGAGLSIMIPAWMKYVYKHDMRRFATFASRVFGITEPDEEAAALAGISALEGFFSSVGLPIRLGDVGIDDARLHEMAVKATNNDTMTIGNFVTFTSREVEDIYRLAL
ncbi:MAG: iron-containing alcohol dehydrogenase [Christensenellales bacterium]